MEPTIRMFNRRVPAGQAHERDIRREWLVTNGLGGYAAGTVDGVFSRRYHGLLIAALPVGRTMTLSGLSERIRLPNREVWYLGAQELSGVPEDNILTVAEFRLQNGLPIWLYEVGGVVLEKRLVLPYRQNTVHVIYQLLQSDGPVRLGVRPCISFRPHDAPVSTPVRTDYRVEMIPEGCEVCSGDGFPPLRLRFQGDKSAFTYEQGTVRELVYPIEEERGYESSGRVWSPGYFRADMHQGSVAGLVASVENWDAIAALDLVQAWDTEQRRRQSLIDSAPEAARTGFGAELVLAADAFVITPGSRVKEAAVARAEGEESWTIMAGYHWFTDWGRDTMISLEGLTLDTGRQKEARFILRSFARHIRAGLIPNFFMEGADEGLYHTADATLWFFHALHRYVTVTGDQDTLDQLLPSLVEIVQQHLKGTLFGIHVDPSDGLLAQGETGYQLTWMDAKVGDWVVTPRRGKAVEINGLWYNALRLLEGWLRSAGDHAQADAVSAAAERTYASFNSRFWSEKLGHLYDVIDGPDGDDASCRPNQTLSFSLTHPVLDPKYWQPVLSTVQKRLLTPNGLRTLSQDHPDYKAVYFGDLRSRDAAYHQGTVWPWLVGPFIDAFLKVNPDRYLEARALLDGFRDHVGEACLGSISEIFDGNPPFTPRGCVAQAWSVAEVLRCWVLTAGAATRESERQPEGVGTAARR